MRAHELRNEAALQQVNATRPAAWADVPVVALEPQHAPRGAHARARRVVGALAACALLAGAIALPVALRSHSRAATPPAAGEPATTGYRSTAVVRVFERQLPSTPTTAPLGIQLADPVQLALAPDTRTRALARSHLNANDPRIHFDATSNTRGDLVSLTVTAPTRAWATVIPRNWATALIEARQADAARRIRALQHNLTLRITRLHRELPRVDAELAKMDPKDYGEVQEFDAPNGNLIGRQTGPPPVPERGSTKLLNLAFERIQILNQLNDSGTSIILNPREASVAAFTHLVSQTPAVLIKPPHHNTNAPTVLIAIGLLLGGVLLAGSAFMLGRRTGRSPLVVEPGGSP